MRLTTRITKLEQSKQDDNLHVVVVFVARPEDEPSAEKEIAEGRATAQRLGKTLQVIRVGWR